MEQLNNIQKLAEMPTISPQGIASGAVLIKLSIGEFRSEKKDKAAAAQIARANGAKVSALTARKDILAECNEYHTLSKWIAKVPRKEFVAETVPFEDGGMRLVTTERLLSTILPTFGNYENEYWRMVDTFVDTYDFAVSEHLSTLGGMYDRSLYPSKEVVRSKYRWELITKPISTADHFVLDLESGAQDAIKQQYQQHFDHTIQAAVNDVWNRLRDNLSVLVRQLQPTGKTNARGEITYNPMHESVFSTVKSMIDLMRDFNLTNDVQMTNTADQLENALYGMNVDIIKNSIGLRKQKENELQSILDGLPSLDM